MDAHADGAAGAGAEGKKKTRAQKRHEKKRSAEQERQQQRAATGKGPVRSAAEEETDQIERILSGLGLQLVSVEADGHCMFRSVAMQLKDRDASSTLTHVKLRRLVADHMLKHVDDFSPFFSPEDGASTFDEYCSRMKETAAWGGQLELRALSQLLHAPIRVLSAHSPPVISGEEFAGEPITLCHHQRLLSLGAHYNGVRAVPAAVEGEGSGAADAEA